MGPMSIEISYIKKIGKGRLYFEVSKTQESKMSYSEYRKFGRTNQSGI